MAFLSLSLFLLSAVSSSLQCSPPTGGNWTPLTVEELARKAPLVIKAYLVRSFEYDEVDTLTRSRRCLHVTKIYKGNLHAQDVNYICPKNFGSEALCRSELLFNVPYIIFLNKENNDYAARYDDIHSAAVPYSEQNSFSDQLNKGVCCSANEGKYIEGYSYCLVVCRLSYLSHK